MTHPLTDVFGAIAPYDVAVEQAIERALQAAIAQARSVWPQIVVDDAVFVAVIARVVKDAGDLPVAIGELAVADLYLARGCATGAPVALEAFAATCQGAVHAALRRMGLAGDAIDEIVQDVRTKLFVGDAPKIESYTGRAGLVAWVRTVATRVAVDRLRKRELADADDGALDAVHDPHDNPELSHFRRTYHAEFKEAFEQALATLDVRERNVLRHHFVDRLTVEEIGALYGVHTTSAFRWLDAARTALAKRTRAAFQARVKVMPAELDSILALLQSQIDLSLSRVLAVDPR